MRLWCHSTSRGCTLTQASWPYFSPESHHDSMNSLNRLHSVMKGASVQDEIGHSLLLSSLSSGHKLNCIIIVSIHATVMQHKGWGGLTVQLDHCPTYLQYQWHLNLTEWAGTCRNRHGSCGRSSWRSLCSHHSWMPRSVCLSPGPRRWSKGSQCRCWAGWCWLIQLWWSLRALNSARWPPLWWKPESTDSRLVFVR